MAFPFTEDHDMIRETVRGFLQDWYDGGKGPEKIFQSGKAHDPEAWKTLAVELGMAGIAIDERYGGAGLGCLLYTSPSPRDATLSRMPSSA